MEGEGGGGVRGPCDAFEKDHVKDPYPLKKRDNSSALFFTFRILLMNLMDRNHCQLNIQT